MISASPRGIQTNAQKVSFLTGPVLHDVVTQSESASGIARKTRLLG